MFGVQPVVIAGARIPRRHITHIVDSSDEGAVRRGRSAVAY